MPIRTSAGLLPWRQFDGRLQVLLGHPGGPFWTGKDAGAWSILKGEVERGEDLLAAAVREFSEESGAVLSGPFVALGSVVQRSGKIVHAWACEASLEPADLFSNTCSAEWPPKSGNRVRVPEIDRYEWLDLPEARKKINPAQAEFMGRLEAAVTGPR
jgi:predicted NUDIX family NTP pyrophosphohydrolase